jgi:hypothetical protein
MLQQEKKRRSYLELENAKLQTGFEAEKKKTASLRELSAALQELRKTSRLTITITNVLENAKLMLSSAAEKQRTSRMQQAVSEERHYMSSCVNSCELFV